MEKIQIEQSNRKPVFVSDELYYSTDLTYTEVHIKCKELCLKKMVTISDETIQAWYVEFLREKWNSKKFNERLSEMRNVKTFGERLDIADWFKDDAVYTRQQLATEIERRMNNIIRNANKILEGQTVTVDIPKIGVDEKEIKFVICKRIERYVSDENKFLTQEIIDKVFSETIKEMNIELNNEQTLSAGARLKMKFNF